MRPRSEICVPRELLERNPLDVLQGRLENVYGLPAKQNEHGIEQLKVAIDVGRQFLVDITTLEALDTGVALFMSKKLPQLLKLMSAPRRAELGAVLTRRA